MIGGGGGGGGGGCGTVDRRDGGGWWWCLRCFLLSVIFRKVCFLFWLLTFSASFRSAASLCVDCCWRRLLEFKFYSYTYTVYIISP